MKNVGLKIISLLLAMVVWAMVAAPRRGQAIERALSADVSLVAMSRAFIITTPTTVPQRVTVRIRGRKPDLDALTSRTVEATVELGWIRQPAEFTITLTPDAFNLPPDVEVVSIDPNKFSFRVEEVRQGTVPVRPFLLGDVPGGYVLGEVTVEPDRVLVSGPASQIGKLSEISTERIIMTGRTATFSQNVAVVSDTPLVRVIAPLTVQVTVPVIGEIGPTLPPPEGGTADEEGQEPEDAGDRRATQT